MASIQTHTLLRDRQINAIKRMLNLNEDVEAGQNEQSNGLQKEESVWKVLIFDDLGRDVISAILRVGDLRACGVTMHMHISQTRHPIPDVPVVYLVEPNTTNIQAITSDLQKGLYFPAYINHLSSIPRALLEDLATRIAETGTSESIAQVHDQYLNFIVSEPDLFSLGMRKENTYWALNSAKTKDEELDHVVDRIVSGLFSVMVTMAVMPIIRCPKGAAAEMIAAKLDRKLRDHILNSKDNNLFSAPNNRPSISPGVASSRPVLVILDRNVDLIPMLSHSWTYQSLVHDVLDMKLNRISVEVLVEEGNPEKGKKKKSYDLAANDFFWAKNAGLPVPQVAEDIDVELDRYKQEANEITRKTGSSSFEDLDNDTSASAQHLKSAISQLPELRERKAVLDMHMSILTGIFQGIGDRKVDTFYQMEEDIMKTTKAQVLEIIKDDTQGSQPNDKLRLFIIWFLSTEQEIARADLERFEEALKAAGANITSLAYIKQVRATTRMTMMTSVPTTTAAQGSAGNELFGRFSSISSRLTTGLRDSGVSTHLENALSGVKSFLPANRDLTVTKITESIMDPAGASSSAIAKTENYLYFDPRSANARGTMPPPSVARKTEQMPGGLGGHGPGMGATFGQRRQGFSEAIVFTVGGGSMDEYGNLQEWAKRTGQGGSGAEKGAAKRRVVYGSTELINASEFLKLELEKLGAEVSS
ncbi:snare docking complex subunit [Calycina marina]|uniref:Snare docking complex subunit n=1 Tax=Calycina marina TaxID=1763456 RepID=A0A9P7Z6V5_9HELO|nr:snare docking complex subunit [Calycina marina]